MESLEEVQLCPTLYKSVETCTLQDITTFIVSEEDETILFSRETHALVRMYSVMFSWFM